MTVYNGWTTRLHFIPMYKNAAKSRLLARRAQGLFWGGIPFFRPFFIQSLAEPNTLILIHLKYNERPYLQYQPQLIATFHVLLVVHPIKLDNIGVVRQSLEDVVLCFDLLVNILQNEDTD